jgi:hypothetical protein
LRLGAGLPAKETTNMAAFTPERRIADNPALIPPTGDRRRKPRIACDPAREEAYWRDNYRHEPYYERGYTFEDYLPAYRVGWEARIVHQDRRSFEETERDLERLYRRNRGASQLGWEKGRHAARAAWERFDDPSLWIDASQ